MKTSTTKKKTAKKEASFIKDEAIIEAPKNLLPDHTEDTAKPVEEEKVEPKQDLIEETKKEVNAEKNEEVKAPELEKTVVQPVVQTVVEEVKPPEEKKDDLPFIDSKPIDLKSDTVVPTSSVAAPPPIPPISIPVTRMDTNSSGDESKGKKILGLILLILVVMVVAGTWFYFANKSKKQAAQDKIVIFKPTGVIESPSPTKVASSEVKFDDYQLEVLNGSGVSGEASKLEELLEAGGIEVFDTGNADKFDYEETIIQAKKVVDKSFLEKLKTLLSKTYAVGKDEVLDTSESADVVVIVGSEKAK